MPHPFRREPLSVEEADRLMAAPETPEEKLCVWGLLETGLRVSELANLRPQDIQWQQRSLRIKGKGGPYGTRSKFRIVPLSDRLRALFEPYFTLHDTFPCTTRTIQRIMKRVANRAQISRPVSPHVLRHTFAMLYLHKGGSLPALQKILGHDHLSTTAIYLNFSPEHVLQEFHAKW